MRMLFRVFALLVLILGALSAVRRLMGAFTSSQPQVGATNAGRLVKDPVCGTYIPQSTALAAANEFFCSEECRRKYLA